jgi:regulatory protein
VIVEALVSDPRRPGTTRVFVDGKAAWTVPSAVVIALHLQEGMPLPSAAIDALERAADEEAAYRSGLRMLERRGHSVQELALKLRRKGHTDAAGTAAVERLLQLQLLDDRAFARTYVYSRRRRGWGPARLRHDLQRLGVDRDAVADALSDTGDSTSDDPLEHARHLVLRRAGQFRELSVDARRRRLTAFLARRGFAGALARRLVEEAIGQLSSP